MFDKKVFNYSENYLFVVVSCRFKDKPLVSELSAINLSIPLAESQLVFQDDMFWQLRQF